MISVLSYILFVVISMTAHATYAMEATIYLISPQTFLSAEQLKAAKAAKWREISDIYAELRTIDQMRTTEIPRPGEKKRKLEPELDLKDLSKRYAGLNKRLQEVETEYQIAEDLLKTNYQMMAEDLFTLLHPSTDDSDLYSDMQTE